jgi:hypothetical protein
MATSPVLILFLAAGVSYQQPTKTSDWITFTPREADFRIEFPAQPMEQGRQIPSAVGTIEQKVYYVRHGGCVFTLQRYHYQNPFPLEGLSDRLAEHKKTYLQGQVKLIRDGTVTVDNITGDQFEYKGPSPRANGTVTSLTRHFIKGSTYYAITVMSPPNQDLPHDADRFVESFHFNAKEPAKAAATPRRAPTAKAVATPPKGAAGAMANAPAAGARRPIADGTPEDALRSFLMAMVERDEAALRVLTVPKPETDLAWLLRGQAAPPEAVERLRTVFSELKIQRLKPGDQFKLARGQVGTVRPEEVGEDRAVVLSEGSPLPTRLQRIDGHWKVDAGPIIAGRKAAAAAQQKAQGR